MTLEFFVLGSGSAFPAAEASKVRNPAGYALKRGERVFLFDLGFGNLRQLARAGLDPGAIEHAFFTHRHPDHVGDLAALLFRFNYDGPPRSGRLRLYGPRGFCAFVARLIRAYRPWLRPCGFKLDIKELREGDTVLGRGWRVACREVPHSTEALAYRFESREGSVCYTGDTGFDAGLADFAAGVDLFVLECTLPDSRRAPGHLRVREALDLARASGARKVVFSHLSASSERALDRALRARRSMRKAADLLKLSMAENALRAPRA